MSRSPTILIITHSGDNECVANVVNAVRERGAQVIRFDTDQFPTNIGLSVHYKGAEESLLLRGDGYELDLGSVTGVWYRRVAIGHAIPNTMDKQLRRVSMDESVATVQGMIASLNAFHLDHVHRIRRAENKQRQLKIARSLEIATPRTLITNEAAAVRQFAGECSHGLIMKTQSAFSVYEEGQQQVVFTNLLQEDDFDHLEELRYCPAQFQECIPKALELRATVVGNKVFTASIDSQGSSKTRFDWRRDGIGLIDDWKPYQLPVEVKNRLLKMMDIFGLNYGAADFILTPDGEHVFLEVNPAGEFYWLEKNPGFPISAAIADLLIDREGAR